MRKPVCTLFAFLFSFSVYSQIGTDFWVAPPDVSDLHNAPGGEPIYLWVQSQSNTAALVTVSMPANGSFIPIVVTVNPGTTQRVNLTAFKASLETRPTNTIANSGLRIQATQPVSVIYEIANTSNGDYTSLKGVNGLGNYFYIPFHKHAAFENNVYAAPHQAIASFDIVATQNATIIRIYSPIAVDGHAALNQFLLTLNAGQTYSCGFTGTNYQQPFMHPSGAVVLSDKPIAITLKDDSQRNPAGACYDLQFEQIVPVSNVGTDYIAVKGSLPNNGDESLVIMATENNTPIYINNQAIASTVMFAGEYYRLDIDFIPSTFDNSIFIHADKPVYIMHFSGIGCEMGDALLPPINLGSSSINVSRSNADAFYLNLVTRTANINSFTITGNGTATISPASFLAVPGTGGQFSAARIQYDATQFPVDETFTIQNSGGAFQAAVMQGNISSNARFTYVTPFGAMGALPLRLLRLTGRAETDGNYLQWIAGEDGERYRYALQVQEGSDWVTLDYKESGTIQGNRSYDYVHSLQASGARLYRVAATELSINKTIYSNTVMLNRGHSGRGSMTVYPNPAKDQLSIQLSGADGSVSATIYSISGQLMKQVNGAGNSFDMDIKDLPAGVYLLKVADAKNQWQEKISKL